MAISEAQRQEIIDYTGSMSVREIAKKVGCSTGTVSNVQKSLSDVQIVPLPRTRAPAHEKGQTADLPVQKTVQIIERRSVRYDEPLHIIGRNAIASTMTKQLMSEMKLYEDAKIRADDDPQAKWEMVQHQKLVQSALNALAKWCGLDKGTMPGADDAVESVTEKDVDNLSLDEMLKIASKL